MLFALGPRTRNFGSRDYIGTAKKMLLKNWDFEVFSEIRNLRFGAVCLSVGPGASGRGHTGLLEGFLLRFRLCKLSYQGAPIDPLEELFKEPLSFP